MTYHSPYSDTVVPVSRTQDAIRKLLFSNGAVGYQFTEMPPPHSIVELKWARKVITNNVPMVQPVRIRISFKNRRLEQVYRAIYYHLKAKFEIVAFGILSFEEEFMPYFLTQLPDGTEVTMAEAAMPYLRRGLAPVFEPLRLPEKAGEEK